MAHHGASLLSFILFFSPAFAITPPEGMSKRIVMHKGVEITVGDYIAPADVFELTINKEPAVGPNFATPEALKKAVGLTGTTQDFIKKMQREPNSVYVLRADLPLLWDQEVVERRKAKAKK
jgi:hypothetical protein